MTSEEAMPPCPTHGCEYEAGHETPHGRPPTLCPDCGKPIDSEILAETPECPHGWIDLSTMTLADQKALFARAMPEISLDPRGPQ